VLVDGTGGDEDAAVGTPGSRVESGRDAAWVVESEHDGGGAVFFYRPLTFYWYPAVTISTAVYRGIPLNTARIQISNQNRFLPLVQTVLNGIPRYK
jgi:hypothetical protein